MCKLRLDAIWREGGHIFDAAVEEDDVNDVIADVSLPLQLGQVFLINLCSNNDTRRQTKKNTVHFFSHAFIKKSIDWRKRRGFYRPHDLYSSHVYVLTWPLPAQIDSQHGGLLLVIFRVR